MNDREQLNLLGTFHYVLGGLALVFGCFPILHLAFGIAMLTGGLTDESGQAPPVFFGVFMIVTAAIFIGLAWTMGVIQIFTGKRLKQRQRYKFCFVVAAIECALFPFGTILGIFTLIVLNRPAVQTLFGLTPTNDQTDG